MERRVDLHVHTYYSDGTFSPEEVLKKAKELKLAALAICDHDCIDGIKEAQEIAPKYGIEIIPGVEVTSEKDGTEIHILGYFIDIVNGPILKLLENIKTSRIKRIYTMVEKLNKHNVNIRPEAVFELSQKGSISRLHLATALCKEGFVSTIREAFAKYIGDHAPCYVTKFNTAPEETIKAILESGGVPVCAHPKVMGRDDFIPSFVKAGLRGLEVYHTDQGKSASQYYLNLTRKLGLLATGGSDCHGIGKGRILMGRVTMPYSTVDKLRKESDEIRRERGL